MRPPELERKMEEIEHRLVDRERHLVSLVESARDRVRHAQALAARAALAGVVILGLWGAWTAQRWLLRGRRLAAWRR